MAANLQDRQAKLLARALRVAEERLGMYVDAPLLQKPEDVRDYLKLWAAQRDAEAFGAVWLTTQHAVIGVDTLFTGTIDGASVYPRIVVKAALAHNAAAVILFHNHPSGCPDPSKADRVLTQKLKEALALVDVRVLDHMIVGSTIASLAELGYL